MLLRRNPLTNSRYHQTFANPVGSETANPAYCWSGWRFASYLRAIILHIVRRRTHRCYLLKSPGLIPLCLLKKRIKAGSSA